MNAETFTEVERRLAGQYHAVLNKERAVTCRRGWIEWGRHDKPGVFTQLANCWEARIGDACDAAEAGSKNAVRLTLEYLTEPIENGDGTWSHEFVRDERTGSEVTLSRVCLLLEADGKRWTGKHVSGASPKNFELANPENWEPA